MHEIELLEKFVKELLKHGKRKASLYDGVNRNHPIDLSLRFAMEELGEIAGAITRDRIELAKYECFDLAHCAFLIYLSLEMGETSPFPK